MLYNGTSNLWSKALFSVGLQQSADLKFTPLLEDLCGSFHLSEWIHSHVERSFLQKGKTTLWSCQLL